MFVVCGVYEVGVRCEWSQDNYRLPSSSLCCLMSLTTSSAPETSIRGRLSQGPASSLRSEASEARDDFLEEARLLQAVPRRLTCGGH